MITIVKNNIKKYIRFDPKVTIGWVRSEIGKMYNLNIYDFKLYYNMIPLDNDKKLLSEVMYDNATIVVEETAKKNGGMFNNPMMESMLNSPQNINNIIEAFPSLKKQFEENKELQELLRNGGLNEELQKAARNPEYANDQMKNLDLTMSKLENMPGGLNMMSSLMKDVRDPMMSFCKPSPDKDFQCGYEQRTVKTEPVIPGAKENLTVKYKQSLATLCQYDFKDINENIKALEKFNGDIDSAMLFLATERENKKQNN